MDKSIEIRADQPEVGTGLGLVPVYREVIITRGRLFSNH